MDVITKRVIVICGIKNSGKTTLIRKLIPILNDRGYQVATIKHDGHEFESDVPGTDSYYHQKAGAYGTAVFSKGQFMVTKKMERIQLEKLLEFFPEADLILVEGCKESSYPKIEVIRSINQNQPVSNPKGRFLLVTDIPDYESSEPCCHPEETERIADAIIRQLERNGSYEVNEDRRRSGASTVS